MLAVTTAVTAGAGAGAAAAAADDDDDDRHTSTTTTTSEDVVSSTVSISAAAVATSTSCPSREPALGFLGKASDMRRTKQQPELDDSLRPVEEELVLLGWPFTYARQPWLGPVHIPLERAVQFVVALDAALHCCRSSTAALHAALKESSLALRGDREPGGQCCNGADGGGGDGGGGGGSGNSSELEAMKEVMRTLWRPGGVRTNVASSLLPLPYNGYGDDHDEIVFLARWVLLHVKKDDRSSREEDEDDDQDRATLVGALERQILDGSTYSSPSSSSSSSSSSSLFLSSAPSEENDVAPPPRHGKATPPAVPNSAAQTLTTTASSWGAAEE
ncbi:unnamed protein product, partial [Laminaria digitata]